MGVSPCPHKVFLLCAYQCPNLLPRTPVQLCLGPPQWAHFTLIIFLKALKSKHSHIQRYWGLGLQHMNFRGHNSGHNTPQLQLQSGSPLPWLQLLLGSNQFILPLAIRGLGVASFSPVISCCLSSYFVFSQFWHTFHEMIPHCSYLNYLVGFSYLLRH